ncbi:cyclase [Streptomyces sp. SA15]|uniref:SRPBCC family protein n=1 Tax=Streptomyces sp. SA15 TaxID=934019 RepID=UPI000BB0BBF9|nr:SRPBCC family protein [Streptomyces sp. SA15]PAZ15340.1 cyclase [Streptomyces sp. SA15]
MAEGKAAERGSADAGTLTKVREQAQQTPGADRLKEELERYIQARVELMLEGVGHRLGAGARRLAEAHMSPGGLAKTVGKGAKKLGEQLPSGAEVLTSTASHAKDAVVDKAKDVLPGKKHGRGPGGGTGRGLTIIEDIDVGVPVREAYNQWTQFQDFERFAKGVVDVEQKDDTTTQWEVKVAKASRRWRGDITEQVPDERIAWTTEGDKATTKGVVTFHPLGENLTKVLLVLEYFPKGVVEKTGSLWRAQGRRARLDLKLYRTFVMMRGEATGGWRGEIREGKVVRTPEEVEEAEAEEGREEEAEGRSEEEEPEEEEEERAEKEPEEEEPEERYEDEEEEEEEEEEEPEERFDEDEEEDEEDEDEGPEPDDRYDDAEEEAPEKGRRHG